VLLADVRRGLETGDAATLRRAAHTLKSTSAQFGATDLAALCKQIEALAAAGDVQAAAPLIERVVRDYPAVEAALNGLLATEGVRNGPA
jgi:HPt (histidine-containing phosphotransfer) domain-containing protein